MEPIDYLGALRRSWRLLVVLGMIGLLVAVLYPVSGGHGKKERVKQPTNPWSSSAVVGAAPAQQNTDVGGGVTGQQIVFYATESSLLRKAADAAGLRGIKVSNLPTYMKASLIVPAGVGKREAADANTVRLTARGPSSAAARKLAREYSKEVGILLNSIAAARTRVTSRVTASSGYAILTPALVATKTVVRRPGAGPTKSRKVRALIGLTVGVLLAAIIVLAREVLSKRLRSSSRAEATFGFPVIVEIPAALNAIGRRILSVDVVSDPTSPAAEAYRMLRMSVLFEALASKVVQTNDFSYLLTDTGTLGEVATGDSTPEGPEEISAEVVPNALPAAASRQVVLVVSATAESTRPQVAANLAAAYAEAGQRVIVIGTGDLRAGQIPGGGTNLEGEIRPQDVEAQLEASWVEGVFRLDLRNFLETSGQLVSRMPAVLEASRAVSDAIIIEALPLLAVHHVEALSHLVDVVLVVGESGTTTFDEARRAGDLLRRMGAPVLGVVLTNVRLPYRDPRQQLSGAPLELESGPGLDALSDLDDSNLASSGTSAHSPA
jgi:Mrp family chromosome partitioning ATPase